MRLEFSDYLTLKLVLLLTKLHPKGIVLVEVKNELITVKKEERYKLDYRISVQNTTTTSHLYRCSVSRYNFNSLTYDLSDDGSKILSNGETTSAKISRNKNSYVYNYVHYANSFASTSGTSSTMVDSYTFIAKQYYD